MSDRVPHLTSPESRPRYDSDDHTHIVVTVMVVWVFAVACAAVWIAGG